MNKSPTVSKMEILKIAGLMIVVVFAVVGIEDLARVLMNA